ncbi:acyltransferase [Daejeonella sp.]|uniref:acyltransferase n=1 Tax=Daejeonella sp. TaxID=2805397 RepID=UPI002731C2F3|nr:acyltransferase [Daejeonella sp.]MDP2414347.1 acyltransferase [Daejeonella sp.]
MSKIKIVNGVKIHDSSWVSDNCKIGEGTYVWMNVQIREGVTIGENCIISKDCYIDLDVSIGNRVKIQNGVSVYKGVTIEDDVFLGPHMVFTNDLYPRSFNHDWKITPTIIKKGASIGANATIVCGSVIGEFALIGAGTVVNKNVPPYSLMVGNPAKLVGYVCKCGKRLDAPNTITKPFEVTCLGCNELIILKRS